MSERVYTVAALIAEVNTLLEQGFSGVRVEGEVTNSSSSGRGHVYFSLKDDAATLDCVMWSSRARRLKFELEDGLAVLATGSLTVYPQRGRFQMVVENIQPQGVGALQLAFEQLKKKLEAEGLFAAERKRPLPALPNRVGIVTSATGAALQDMLKILLRFPHLEVVVAPAMVQGEGAAAEIAAAVKRLTASKRVNLIIVSRGGGSLEDLWAFNEEEVARAMKSISQSPTLSPTSAPPPPPRRPKWLCRAWKNRNGDSAKRGRSSFATSTADFLLLEPVSRGSRAPRGWRGCRSVSGSSARGFGGRFNCRLSSSFFNCIDSIMLDELVDDT